MGTCLQYSLDFCLAWALIGEWTSRVLFPVPKGPWPRHGHAGALLQNCQCRSPRIVAWARAAFEQGALPSLLMMPGIAPVFSLLLYRTFQATEIMEGRQRPAIMHAYGEPRRGWKDLLPRLQLKGGFRWLGTAGKPPMWASVGLRPVAGTTIDFRVLPPSLSEREKLLMLSCWQQWDAAGVPGSALSQWLVGIDVDSGPDGRNSPTCLKQNFDAQEAADLYQAVHLHTMEDLGENGPNPSQLALRILTYEYPLEAILAIYYLSATGYLPAKFPHDQWNEAVRWHGHQTCCHYPEWSRVGRCQNHTFQIGECGGWGRIQAWGGGMVEHTELPYYHPRRLLSFTADCGAWRGNSTAPPRNLPETLHVEATGLGGRDLLYPIPWDISIRSDKEGQSIYGPSLAPMEETVDVPGIFGGTETVQVTALGRSKAAHEFLVLHYFGLDSAKHWDALLFDVLPAVRFPGASARRAIALEMFGASHIAPSHRRMPHVLWADYSMNLVWNLLMGDTRVPQTHWYLTSALTSEAFRLEVLLVLAPYIYYGKCQM